MASRCGEFGITHACAADIVCHSSRSLPAIAQGMSEAAAKVACCSMSVARRKGLGTCTGFDPTPEGLLNAKNLISAMGLPNTLVLDRMHCLLQGGAMNSMLAQYVAEIGDRRGDFHLFLGRWTVDPQLARNSFKNMQDIVTTGNTQGHDRPSCSEFSCCIEMIRCWLTVSSDDSAPGRMLLLLCEFVAAIQFAK